MSYDYIYKYRVQCLTESAFVLTGYRYETPTYCPNDINHTINGTGTSIVDIKNVKQVIIDQSSDISNFGYFRVDQHNISIGASATVVQDITYPYNVVAYSTFLMPTADNIGDELNVVALPNTAVGLLIDPIGTGATALHIASLENLNNGFLINVTDGINTNDLKEIVSLNGTGGIIICSTGTINSFAAGAVVRVSVPRVKNFIFSALDNLVFGLTRQGATGLPAGGKVRITYKNNSGVSKNFSILAEIGY